MSGRTPPLQQAQVLNITSLDERIVSRSELADILVAGGLSRRVTCIHIEMEPKIYI